jgi:hypothetical protein
VKWSFGDGEEIECGEACCRLCREDNREKGVAHKGVSDGPRVMGPDELRKVYGRCPGTVEDSTLHWRVAGQTVDEWRYCKMNKKTF